MSNEEKDTSPNNYSLYDPFNYNHHHEMDRSCLPFFNDNRNPQTPQNLQAAPGSFDLPYSSYVSFTECLHSSMDYNILSRAFDMSCSSSEVISQIDDASKKQGVGESVGTTSENPSTPNSSISSSSNEAAAAAEEDSVKSKKDKQPKGSEEGDEDQDKSKKVYVSFFYK